VLYAGEEGFPVLLESVLAGETKLVRSVVTDEHGAFALPGLDERDYRLRVVDPASALVFEAGPLAAGERDLVLRRPAGAVWERVRGTVVGRDGQGLAGLQVCIDPESLRILCGRRAALEVVCATSRNAIAVSVQDATGELLELAVPTSAGSSVADSVELVDGRSPVMTVSDAGVLLVLYGEGYVELERVPIALRADGVNRVDL
jgi:hypothetical protein